ncbi:D-beta-hydroxybutyrate dehydrogenase, mitochondrial [Anabrus simplex]|uniref:D-beta-hydroxybutyrate dehydrogenase, mitochondrial n=1 Tax=Anabrus simplex TaxID=316456 RepID=UPI0035A3355F
MPEFYLDEIWKAAVRGLQFGLAVTLVLGVGQLLGLLGGCILCILLLTTTLGTTLALFIDTLQVPVKDKAVLITGCDSGFGYELALRLEKLGFVVFAGCLLANKGGAGAQQLKDARRRNIHVVQLDVSSDEEIRIAVEYVKKHLPSNGLWGVVNNAGIFTFGHVEWCSIDTAKSVMNVNVWGTLRIIKAFLPLVRQTKGRIVNVGSVSGRQCSLNFTLYSITKYSIEALSDSLRFEMRRFGVDVALIEPGNFASATKIFQPDAIRSTAMDMWKKLPDDVQNSYTQNYFDSVVNNMIKSQATPTPHSLNMEPVLLSMTQALLQKFPHPRYQPANFQYVLRTWVNTHLPEWVYEMFYI